MNIYIDLDGTILNVFERYCGIFNLFVEGYGFKISLKEYRELRQMGFSDIDIMIKKLGLSISVANYKEFKHQLLENREWLLKDTIIGNPEELKKYDFYFAIITQRYNEKEAIYQVESLGLNKVFNEIIVLNPISKRNRKYEYLRNKVGIEDCIIGDSLIELNCARRLGIRGFFVKTGLYGEQIVEKEKIKKNYIECVKEIANEREGIVIE